MDIAFNCVLGRVGKVKTDRNDGRAMGCWESIVTTWNLSVWAEEGEVFAE
jgi:hypothetical protein